MTKKLLAAALAACLLPVAGAEAKPRALKGTVVHKNHNAKSFVVATAKGHLAEVRARKGNARFARKVAFRASVLRSGSYSTRKVRYDSGSAAKTALVRGAVTFVDTTTRTFTVSDNGASILVHLADETKTLPAVGDAVLVTADLSKSTPTTLEASDVAINPAAAAKRAIEIEGVVLAIDESTRTLTLSADDSEESGEMVAVVLPAELDLAKFKVGDSVELLATLNDDGQTFTATAIDDHDCGDDDHNDRDDGDEDDDNHDDDHGDHQRGDDHSDSSRGSDDGSDDE
jgi:Cu/Ag efflux protein CusF